MTLEDITQRPPIYGITPFNELPIDSDIWSKAHGHHHQHRYLHATMAHRPGIVAGLEVFVSPTNERSIIVAPGVGIDPEGQMVILRQPVSSTLDERGQFYLLLSYLQQEDPASKVDLGGGGKCFGFHEGRSLIKTKELPSTPYLELARVFRSNPEKPVTDAKNPFDPESDEINLLHRRVAFPRCYAEVGVTELSYVSQADKSTWKPNRAGLWHLLREGSGRGFHLDFHKPNSLAAQPMGASTALAYVAGTGDFPAPATEQLESVRRFLDGGGLLFGEAAGAAFGKGFQEMAKSLGAKLKKVPKGHPLLTAHYVFAAPPPGAGDSGELMIDDDAGILFGTWNYGGAWQGDVPKPDAADARDRIRTAQEFGLNIIAYAAERHRRHALVSALS